MRALLTVTALCLTVFLMGCQNGQSMATGETSPGAVAECGSGCDKPCCAAKEGACCGTCGGEADCGAAKEGACCGTCGGEADCGAAKEGACCGTCDGEAPSPGAVGECGSGCAETGSPNQSAVLGAGDPLGREVFSYFLACLRAHDQFAAAQTR